MTLWSFSGQVSSHGRVEEVHFDRRQGVSNEGTANRNAQLAKTEDLLQGQPQRHGRHPSRHPNEAAEDAGECAGQAVLSQ